MILPEDVSMLATEAEIERLEEVRSPADSDIASFFVVCRRRHDPLLLCRSTCSSTTISWRDGVVVAKDSEARDRARARLASLFAKDFPDAIVRIPLELRPPVGSRCSIGSAHPTTAEARHYAEQVGRMLRALRPRAQRHFGWAEKSKGRWYRVDQEGSSRRA